MSITIPMIRAASISPMRRWLKSQGRAPEPYLSQAGLDWVPNDDPYIAIPLRGVVDFLVAISRDLGPDTPYRLVDGRGGYEIGLIGSSAFCGPTVREGFQRLTHMMPAHCTHEMFVLTETADGLQIRDGWLYKVGDNEILHFVQQYVAALVDMICSVACGASPSVDLVNMVPHPEAGLNHLRPWLGDKVQPAIDRALNIVISDSLARKHFPDGVQKEALASFVPDALPLRQGDLLSDDVSLLVYSMLATTRPTIDQVAAAAGVSRRTLSRKLRNEGESFSSILERTRAQIAIERLRSEPAMSAKDIATELGYPDQATLTRMVKRWTGQTPSSIRKCV